MRKKIEAEKGRREVDAVEPNTLDIRINHTSTGDSKEKKRQQKHSTSLESGAGPVPNTRDLNQVRNTKKQK